MADLKIRWKTLVWTVEWILNDGTSKIGCCPANTPIAEAYSSQFSKVEPARKRKRQRLSHRSASPSSDVSSKLTVSTRLPSSASFPHAATIVAHSSPPTTLGPLKPLPQPSPTPQCSPVGSHSFSEDHSLPVQRTLHFYLLHPGTPLPTRILIPLSSTSMLESSLRHRVVLEFPTVYALRFAPDELPTGFLTEEEYLRAREQKRINLVEATLHENPPMPEADDQATTVPECFNAEQLLHVLKQDLGMRH